jgi:predicted DCC family thiol-disulfide oxidoreductase YuxK
MSESDKMIVFFDGVCHLCQGVVQFTIPRDRTGQILFSSLQSAYAKKTLGELGVAISPTPESLVVLTYLNGKPKVEHASDSALRIAGRLSFPWNLALAFRVIPRFIRDSIYFLIARNRYRLFGKSETCYLPRAEWKSRFLD